MKGLSRVLRVVLAAALSAGPAAAGMRLTPGEGEPIFPGLKTLAALPGAIPAAPPALFASPSVSAPPTLAAPSVLAAAESAARPVAPSPAAALRAMRSGPAAAEGIYDGRERKDAADGEADASEDMTADIAAAVPQLPELYVAKESRSGIKQGRLTAHAGLIKGDGSAWYYGKFQKGALAALKSGGQTLFVTRIESVKIIKIASMQRKDFEGLFSPQRMAGRSITRLRRALVRELNDRQERGRQSARRNPAPPLPISTESKIGLVRFLSAAEARNLPENKDESAYPVAPREAVLLPEALSGLNHLLPKTVLLDMRLFPDGVPYPLMEDMTKLMKSGVYFILLSDKPHAGPGSVEELLTRRLSTKQRDAVSRYKMVVLSDDGNSLSEYDGNFSQPLPSARFASQDLERMEYVASYQFRHADVNAKSTRFEVVLGKKTDAEAARGALFDEMARWSLRPERWQWSATRRDDGRAVVTARPQTLVSAVPHLLEVMRSHKGMYDNNSDMMVISRDPALLAAFPGSVQPAAHLESDGERLADESLASLLGPYRWNKPGDLAASASKLESSKRKSDRGAGDSGTIFMMIGHVMHTAFNWAVWKYRNTGILPTADETVQAGREIWENEIRGSTKNLLGSPGESLAGFHETVELRLRAMHRFVDYVLKLYPIAVGTELPNMVVIDRFKRGGAAVGRDIFRVIFDFVVARETADGKLEVAVLDFKTGEISGRQSLEKNTQVRLYDLLVRRMWRRLPLPYGGTGERFDVADYKILFLYTAGPYQADIDDWSRNLFDQKILKNWMNRLRRQNNPPAPKAEAKGAKAAKVKIDKTRPKAADAAGLVLPRTVTGLKVRKLDAQKLLAGTARAISRRSSAAPKGAIAILQTFAGKESGRPAEVVAFARVAQVTKVGGRYEWRLTNVTPVKPYVAPNEKPGSGWVQDVPVQGPRRLRREKSAP